MNTLPASPTGKKDGTVAIGYAQVTIELFDDSDVEPQEAPRPSSLTAVAPDTRNSSVPATPLGLTGAAEDDRQEWTYVLNTVADGLQASTSDLRGDLEVQKESPISGVYSPTSTVQLNEYVELAAVQTVDTSVTIATSQPSTSQDCSPRYPSSPQEVDGHASPVVDTEPCVLATWLDEPPRYDDVVPPGTAPVVPVQQQDTEQNSTWLDEQEEVSIYFYFTSKPFRPKRKAGFPRGRGVMKLKLFACTL